MCIAFALVPEKSCAHIMGEVGDRKSALRPSTVKEALRNSPVLRQPEKVQRVESLESSGSGPLGPVPGLPGGSPFVPALDVSSPDVLADPSVAPSVGTVVFGDGGAPAPPAGGGLVEGVPAPPRSFLVLWGPSLVPSDVLVESSVFLTILQLQLGQWMYRCAGIQRQERQEC